MNSGSRKSKKTLSVTVKVNERLIAEGWTVLRFWGKRIESDVASCVDDIDSVLRRSPQRPFRMVDLCAE